MPYKFNVFTKKLDYYPPAGSGTGTPDVEVVPLRGIFTDLSLAGKTVTCTEADVQYPIPGAASTVFPPFVYDSIILARGETDLGTAKVTLWDDDLDAAFDFVPFYAEASLQTNQSVGWTGDSSGHNVSWRVSSDTPGATVTLVYGGYVLADTIQSASDTYGNTNYDLLTPSVPGNDRHLGGYIKDARFMLLEGSSGTTFDCTIGYTSGLVSENMEVFTPLTGTLTEADFGTPFDVTMPYKQVSTLGLKVSDCIGSFYIFGSYQFMATPMAATGGGGAVAVQDEGIQVEAAAATLNFKGAGVTATKNGTAVDITIPGGGSASFPDQAGHAGEYLTTDGANVSWAEVVGGAGSQVIESDTLTGTTADPSAYNSGDFLYNTVYRKLWLNIAQLEWHLMSGGAGTPGIYSATYPATY